MSDKKRETGREKEARKAICQPSKDTHKIVFKFEQAIRQSQQTESIKLANFGWFGRNG